ncbi:MAG: prepilin-type N-terminal cleavage/methylation domain-containing protein [Planctomycetes bacterium]|nr:prepilin-type N-terminal cleavage/methylation domain-containing protein [Planctomycetota bacterium]
MWSKRSQDGPGCGRTRSSPGRLRALGGFTLAELLIAMTLLAMILGSVAMAMRGASEAVAFGNDKSRSNMIATLVMDRLRTDIRRADVVTLNSPSNVISLTMPNGEQKSYAWSGSADSTLIYSCAANPSGVTLAENVLAFTLTSVEEYSEIRDATVPINVHVVLEVRHGEATTRLETTVRPRRNVI